jgi:hypothetical protein
MRWSRRAESGRDGGRRISPSLVISLLALFVALSGTSYAVTVVTGKNVKDGSLTGKDVKDNSLTSGDVRNGSLRLRDFRSGELPKAPGARGPAGPAGPAGPGGGGCSERAFARVTATGDVDGGASKNIAAVATAAGDGMYCLNVTTGTPKSIALTIDVSGADSRKSRISGSAVPAAVAGSCPAGADIVVFTVQETGAYPATATDLPFYVAVDG